MKTQVYLGIIFLFLSTVIFAQAPLGFNYQAALRNAEGEPIVNQTVGLRIGIVQESVSGTVVYSEEHQAETNAFGLVNLMIGTGDVQSGVFADIDWSQANYFIKIELDAENNGNYVTMGVSQLLSVPFANYAFSGNAGKSAYEVWLSLDNSGTEEDFINSLTGPSGTSSWTDGEEAVTTTKNVGIGTANPTSSLQIMAPEGV
ncbi:MAG: hypothetical protein R6U85_05715, partial [Salinivirgaceae bacterium]